MSSALAAATGTGPAPDIVPVYVWERPVRATHWLIVGSIVVLAVTGFYIGHPFIAVGGGPARDHFVTGTVKVVHFYAAIVFGLAVLTRIAWMFLGNKYARWDQFIPGSRRRLYNMFRMLRFYLLVRREPPLAVGHNALAGLSYALVFLLCLAMMGTGFALHSASAAVGSPMRIFVSLVPLFGGLQGARWIHHVGMWLLIVFCIHHVYSAVLISAIERNALMESIFSGYKFFRRSALRPNGDV